MEYLQYIIPAVSLIVVQLIVSFKQQRINDIKHDMTVSEIKKDIARLEEKQDKHNSLIERMVKVEESDKAQWKRIDEFRNRLP